MNRWEVWILFGNGTMPDITENWPVVPEVEL